MHNKTGKTDTSSPGRRFARLQDLGEKGQQFHSRRTKGDSLGATPKPPVLHFFLHRGHLVEKLVDKRVDKEDSHRNSCLTSGILPTSDFHTTESNTGLRFVALISLKWFYSRSQSRSQGFRSQLRYMKTLTSFAVFTF